MKYAIKNGLKFGVLTATSLLLGVATPAQAEPESVAIDDGPPTATTKSAARKPSWSASFSCISTPSIPTAPTTLARANTKSTKTTRHFALPHALLVVLQRGRE